MTTDPKQPEARKITEAEMIDAIKVDTRVWFAEERMPYTVQARNDRWIICTKPFAARKTVIYTIIDIKRNMRGPDNLVFGGGYETREECEANLAILAARDSDMELSYRRRIPLFITKTQE